MAASCPESVLNLAHFGAKTLAMAGYLRYNAHGVNWPYDDDSSLDGKRRIELMCERRVGESARLVCLALPGREVACRAVIFDKDGTLVDPTGVQSRLTRIKALRAAAGAATGPLQGAATDPIRRQGGQRAASPGHAGDENPSSGPGRAWQMPPDAAGGVGEWPWGPDLMPGVADMLATCRSLGLRMAVATGDRRRRAEDTLAALGVADHFAVVIGIDDVPRGKPAPDMVHVACERLGCSPGEVIVVGDSPADLMMGRAAGVAACIGVSGGFATSSERLGALADAVVSTVAELSSLLVPPR